MIRYVLAIAVCACGPAPPPPEMPPPSVGRAIAVEWKAAQADDDQVLVTLVVDRKPHELGLLPAATEFEAGTPHTCALRAAHPLLTEFVCGDLSAFFSAELDASGELVVSLVDGNRRREVKRIAVYGEGLAVAPYRLPYPGSEGAGETGSADAGETGSADASEPGSASAGETGSAGVSGP